MSEDGPSEAEFVSHVNRLARDEYDRQRASGVAGDVALTSVSHALVAVAALIIQVGGFAEEEWLEFSRQVWRDVHTVSGPET